MNLMFHSTNEIITNKKNLMNKVMHCIILSPNDELNAEWEKLTRNTALGK